MHLTTIGRTTALVIGTLLALGSNSHVEAADPKECSGRLSGQISTDEFRFQFGSVSSTSESTHHYIVHCLRGDSKSRPMRFKWEKTGLQGVLIPGRYNYSKQDYQSDAFAFEPATLWYGNLNANTDITTQILVPKEGVHPARNSTTEARLIVPANRLLMKNWSLAKSQEANQRVLTEGTLLLEKGATQAINVDFDSISDQGSRAIVQSIRISSPDEQFWDSRNPKLWVSVEDPWLHYLLFRTPTPVPLSSSSTWTFAEERDSAEHFAWHTTQLSILGPDARSVFASVRLSYRK